MQCRFSDEHFWALCNPAENFATPYGITLNSANTLVFVASIFGQTVQRCKVDASGIFTDCSIAASEGGSLGVINGPSDVALNSDLTRAFVLNYSSNSVAQCPITDSMTGDFGTCTNTGGDGYSSAFTITLLN